MRYPVKKSFFIKNGGNNWGDYMIKQSEILNKKNNFLVDGALHIDVELQFKPKSNYFYVPSNPLTKKYGTFLKIGMVQMCHSMLVTR